jgi:hypothetical protein
MSCCDTFGQSTATADRLPNPIIRDHDECGYPVAFKGVVGTNYPDNVPVKLGAVPGTVEPALDGVGAIGIVTTPKEPVVAGSEVLTVKTFVAEMAWADIATAVGASPTDQAAWWAMVPNLINVVKYLKF